MDTTASRRSRRTATMKKTVTVVVIKMNRIVWNTQMMHFQLTMGRIVRNERVARTGRLMRRQVIVGKL
jgi:hypothetical protein